MVSTNSLYIKSKKFDLNFTFKQSDLISYLRVNLFQKFKIFEKKLTKIRN